MSNTPLNKEKCKGCGLCKKFCPVSAISLDDAKIPYVSIESCIGCASCSIVCPPKAIECTETGEHRSVWGSQFKFINCASCSRAFATQKEYELAQKKAGLVHCQSSVLRAEVCETCRRMRSADVFAAAFGERT